MAARQKDHTKREYYCLIQDGMPVRKALKNPQDNLADSFDVFYGPYHGENGIRPQLLQDADKRPKAFKDRNALLKFFQERCGLTNEISIFNAATGEINVLGGSGEHAVTTSTVKPEFKSLPTIHLESAQEKQDAVHTTEILNTLDSIQDKLNQSINHVKPQTVKPVSQFKPVNTNHHALSASSSSDTRVSALMNVHGLFGTKIKTSRSLAFKGSVTGATQAKPTQSNFGIQLDSDGPDNSFAPAA